MGVSFLNWGCFYKNNKKPLNISLVKTWKKIDKKSEKKSENLRSFLRNLTLHWKMAPLIFVFWDENFNFPDALKRFRLCIKGFLKLKDWNGQIVKSLFGLCVRFCYFCKFEPNVVVLMFLLIYMIENDEWKLFLFVWFCLVVVFVVLFGFLWKNFEMCCFCLFFISDNVPTSSDNNYWNMLWDIRLLLCWLCVRVIRCYGRGSKMRWCFWKNFDVIFVKVLGKWAMKNRRNWWKNRSKTWKWWKKWVILWKNHRKKLDLVDLSRLLDFFF